MKPSATIIYLVNALEFDAPTRVMAQVAAAHQGTAQYPFFLAWQRGAAHPELWNKEMGISGHFLGSTDSSHRTYDFLRHYKSASPDIVHTTLVRPTLAYAWMRWRHKLKARWVITHHGIHEWTEKGSGPLGFGITRLMPIVYNQADAITTPSQAARDDLVQAGVNPAKITVIPNGIRILPPAPDTEEEFLYDDLPNTSEMPPLLASAGNLRCVKGYDVLLKAFPAVKKAFPTAALIIWGEGPERPDLERIISRFDLHDNVFLIGHQANWQQNLPQVTIYVQPSRQESFGVSTAEAMATGKPVIVTDAGGLPELVDSGRAGEIVPSDDPTSLADAIIRLLSDPARQIQLGEHARQRIEQQYSLDVMITRYSTLYQSVMGMP